jgi:cytochrome bd-type quinol oxidase subunit 2
MAHSRFLAGLIGPTLVAMAVALFLNDSVIAAMIGQAAQDYVLIFASGLITLVAGLAIVRAHNVWKGWPAIVTIIGWLLILGGLARLFFPSQLAMFAGGLTIRPAPVMMAAVVVLLVGAFLTFKGYRRAS